MKCDLSGLSNMTLNENFVLSQNEKLYYMDWDPGLMMLNLVLNVCCIEMKDFFLQFAGNHSTLVQLCLFFLRPPSLNLPTHHIKTLPCIWHPSIALSPGKSASKMLIGLKML